MECILSPFLSNIQTSSEIWQPLGTFSQLSQTRINTSACLLIQMWIYMMCKDTRIACNYNSAKIVLWLPVHTQSMKILLQLLSVHCTKVTILGSNSITYNISAEQTPWFCECKKLLVCTGARDFWHLIKTHELEQNPTRKPCNASNILEKMFTNSSFWTTDLLSIT